MDTTALKALNSLSARQSKATKNTKKAAEQFLDCMAAHPNAKIRCYPSDMMLNMHSDSSCMNEEKARSTAGGHCFLGSLSQDGMAIVLNGAICTLCAILKHVAASAAEAELGSLFLNTKEAKVIRLILTEMGYPQPPTPIHVDNATAVGIANNTIKKQRSRAMDMRYFWVADQVDQDKVNASWHPGQENLGDCVTKHHPGKCHQQVRPIFTHQKASPRTLRRALPPSVMRGCAKLNGITPHQSRVVLPRGACKQHASHDARPTENQPFLNPSTSNLITN